MATQHLLGSLFRFDAAAPRSRSARRKLRPQEQGHSAAPPDPWHVCLPRCKGHAPVSPHNAKTKDLFSEAERLLDQSRTLVAKAETRLDQAQDMISTKRWNKYKQLRLF